MVRPNMDLYVNYLVLLAVTLLTSVLNLVIVFQTCRGYRHSRSQPMLWLAAGLILLMVVPSVIPLAAASAGTVLGFDLVVYMYYAPVLNRLIEAIGLVRILYSLHSRP